jgi:type IV fimbrial biogenesis protein FimT
MDVAYPLRRRMAGVTLVEMLATSTVAIVVTAAAVPAIGHFNAIQDTAAAVNAISGDLQLARHAAVTSGDRVVLCPSRDGDRCTGGYDWSEGWMVFRDSNFNRLREDSERVLNVRQGRQPGVQILTSTGRRKITYRSDGSTGGSNATFRFCSRHDPGRSRSLIVNNTGRTKLSRRDAKGKPVRCD